MKDGWEGRWIWEENGLDHLLIEDSLSKQDKNVDPQESQTKTEQQRKTVANGNGKYKELNIGNKIMQIIIIFKNTMMFLKVKSFNKIFENNSGAQIILNIVIKWCILISLYRWAICEGMYPKLFLKNGKQEKYKLK